VACWLGTVSISCQQPISNVGVFTVDGFETCVTEVHCAEKTVKSCTAESQSVPRRRNVMFSEIHTFVVDALKWEAVRL